jgi:hypothetical protein
VKISPPAELMAMLMHDVAIGSHDMQGQMGLILTSELLLKHPS